MAMARAVLDELHPDQIVNFGIGIHSLKAGAYLLGRGRLCFRA